MINYCHPVLSGRLFCAVPNLFPSTKIKNIIKNKKAMNENYLILLRTSMHRLSILGLLMTGLLLYNSVQPVNGQEKYQNMYSGQRPYELDWAGRYEDDHTPLIDFEK